MTGSAHPIPASRDFPNKLRHLLHAHAPNLVVMAHGLVALTVTGDIAPLEATGASASAAVHVASCSALNVHDGVAL